MVYINSPTGGIPRLETGMYDTLFPEIWGVGGGPPGGPGAGVAGDPVPPSADTKKIYERAPPDRWVASVCRQRFPIDPECAVSPKGKRKEPAVLSNHGRTHGWRERAGLGQRCVRSIRVSGPGGSYCTRTGGGS